MIGKTLGKKKKASVKQPASGVGQFDIDDPQLPENFDEIALKSGGYPYDAPMKRKAYKDALETLQYELVKLQAHVRNSGLRVVVLFEGRDAAGKGSCIRNFMLNLNHRYARSIALAKPNDTERGQWYFQRYAAQLPSRGDIVLFDRSWYNRAGVERVMGFCTPEEVDQFLREAPHFEGMLVRDGILLHKVYLKIGQEMQLKRFHERRHNPLKQWKFTDMDRAAMGKWNEYTEAEEAMLNATHLKAAPWTVVLANDQRRARLEVIRFILTQHDYEGRDLDAVGKIDERIVDSDAFGTSAGSLLSDRKHRAAQ